MKSDSSKSAERDRHAEIPNDVHPIRNRSAGASQCELLLPSPAGGEGGDPQQQGLHFVHLARLGGPAGPACGQARSRLPVMVFNLS